MDVSAQPEHHGSPPPHVPRRPLPTGRVYHFNVVYNHAKSKLSRTEDTDISLAFTRRAVEWLQLMGLVNSYYHDRDCPAGQGLVQELVRVIEGSEVTVVVLSPGFVRDCWPRYCQLTCFKNLLKTTPASSTKASVSSCVSSAYSPRSSYTSSPRSPRASDYSASSGYTSSCSYSFSSSSYSLRSYSNHYSVSSDPAFSPHTQESRSNIPADDRSSLLHDDPDAQRESGLSGIGLDTKSASGFDAKSLLSRRVILVALGLNPKDLPPGVNAGEVLFFANDWQEDDEAWSRLRTAMLTSLPAGGPVWDDWKADLDVGTIANDNKLYKGNSPSAAYHKNGVESRNNSHDLKRHTDVSLRNGLVDFDEDKAENKSKTSTSTRSKDYTTTSPRPRSSVKSHTYEASERNGDAETHLETHNNIVSSPRCPRSNAIEVDAYSLTLGNDSTVQRSDEGLSRRSPFSEDSPWRHLIQQQTHAVANDSLFRTSGGRGPGDEISNISTSAAVDGFCPQTKSEDRNHLGLQSEDGNHPRLQSEDSHHLTTLGYSAYHFHSYDSPLADLGDPKQDNYKVHNDEVESAVLDRLGFAGIRRESWNTASCSQRAKVNTENFSRGELEKGTGRNSAEEGHLWKQQAESPIQSHQTVTNPASKQTFESDSMLPERTCSQSPHTCLSNKNNIDDVDSGFSHRMEEKRSHAGTDRQSPSPEHKQDVGISEALSYTPAMVAQAASHLLSGSPQNPLTEEHTVAKSDNHTDTMHLHENDIPDELVNNQGTSQQTGELSQSGQLTTLTHAKTESEVPGLPGQPERDKHATESEGASYETSRDENYTNLKLFSLAELESLGEKAAPPDPDIQEVLTLSSPQGTVTSNTASECVEEYSHVTSIEDDVHDFSFHHTDFLSTSLTSDYGTLSPRTDSGFLSGSLSSVGDSHSPRYTQQAASSPRVRNIIRDLGALHAGLASQECLSGPLNRAELILKDELDHLKERQLEESEKTVISPRAGQTEKSGKTNTELQISPRDGPTAGGTNKSDIIETETANLSNSSELTFPQSNKEAVNRRDTKIGLSEKHNSSVVRTSCSDETLKPYADSPDLSRTTSSTLGHYNSDKTFSNENRPHALQEGSNSADGLQTFSEKTIKDGQGEESSFTSFSLTAPSIQLSGGRDGAKGASPVDQEEVITCHTVTQSSESNQAMSSVGSKGSPDDSKPTQQRKSSATSKHAEGEGDLLDPLRVDVRGRDDFARAGFHGDDSRGANQDKIVPRTAEGAEGGVVREATWKYDDVDKPWTLSEFLLPLYRAMVYALSRPEMPFF